MYLEKRNKQVPQTMSELPIDNGAIRNRLKTMIERIGIGNTNFATKADITPSVISNIMNGKSNITLDTLNKVLTAYPDWNRDWLLFGEGDPSQENYQGLIEDTNNNQSSENSIFSNDAHSAPKYPQDFDVQPTIDIEAIRHIASESAQQVMNQLNRDSTTKEIIEIRVFYSDGSYETFSKGTH